jgi:DNA-binding response OmpR family regulator
MNPEAQVSTLLLIDDDRELGLMLSDFLASDNIDLQTCTSGESGLEQFARTEFDLVILDIMLPGVNGLEVLRKLRQTSDVPVIMLTARGDDIDRIIGLEFGADDYLAKPFNPRELLARIKAILRRSHARAEKERHEFGSITLDFASRTASVHGNALPLTGTEFEILRCLLRTPSEVVSKQDLSEKALGRRLLPYDRSIDTHISNLRGKLEKAGNSQETIRNQRGVGYLLVPNDGQSDERR